MSRRALVLDFSRGINAHVAESAGFPDAATLDLRARLILEEALETCAALVGGFRTRVIALELWPRVEDQKPDLVAYVDGRCDVEVVLHGTDLALGLPEAALDACFSEVMRSNMAKLGGPVDKHGKKLKPPGWTPPQLAPILRAHGVPTSPDDVIVLDEDEQ